MKTSTRILNGTSNPKGYKVPKTILLPAELAARIEILEINNGVLKARVKCINGYRAPKHVLLKAAYEILQEYKPEDHRISLTV